VHIKDICTLGRGRVISEIEISEHPGEYPVYSSQTANHGEMGRIDTFDFNGEYVTWTTDGAYAGAVFYRNGKFNCTNVCGTLASKNHNISMQFLAYCLSQKARRYVSYVGNPKLMNNVVAEIPLVIPQDKLEQSKIAEVLSTCDEAIEQTKAIIAKLKRIKQGLMQDLLTKGIDEHGNIRGEKTHKFKDSPLGRIPVGWEVCTLDASLKVKRGFAFKSSDYVEHGLLNFRVTNIGLPPSALGDVTYLPEYFWNRFPDQQLQGEEIVLVMVGATTGKLGRVPIEICPALMNQNMWKLVPKKGVDPDFLWYSAPDFVARHLNQMSGTAREFLSKKSFLKTLTILPPKDEQNRIAEFFSRFDNNQDAEKAYLSKLQAIKRGLMQDLLTGKVRVTPLMQKV